MSSQSSFSYSKPSLNVSFSVDSLNLDLDYVFDPDQDLFHHHVFRGEDTRASFTSFLSASLQNAGISVFKDDQTAGFDGFVVINSRNESGVINDIIENVIYLLDKTDLFIVDNRVRVESRVQDMIQLLDTQQSYGVLLLVIWGMGGIGKTFNHCKSHLQ